MKGNQSPGAASTSSTTGPSRGVGVLLTTARSVKFEHLMAGISGGVVSTLVLHPLDLLKIRFAVDDGKVGNRPSYRGLGHACQSIFRTEGFRGFYRGVTPNVAGAGVAWGFYFLFYNSVKTEMQGGNTKMQLTPAMHMLAAAGAGVLTLIMTNPIWVVKTRMCLQCDTATVTGKLPNDAKVYKGMADALIRIGRDEGFRGLYKGFIPGIWGVSHGAVQFMVYEELKNSYNKHKRQSIDTKLGTGEYLFFAALSKLVAAVTTYPYQVIRARLQDQYSGYSGSMDCIRKTFRYEGVGGFYKGMSPYLVHVLPNICMVLLIYEKLTTVT